jgi:hypothetical protein
MANRIRILASLLFITAACGDDGPSNNDGGNGDGGNTCATAPLAIASVPGMVMGTVKGKGADLNSPEGSCTDEFGYYEPTGEDEVVAINGLTPGMRYGLTLQSMSDDLSLYITASCPPATGMVTGCTTFTDEAVVFFTNDPEVITFTATAATHYVVVDTGIDKLEDGNFTLAIEPATCGPQTEMADCTGGTPYCVDFGCVQCVSGFDCDAAAMPSCSTEGSCVAGPMMCTGDDTRDDGNGDDGPAVATMINAPTTGNPVTTTGNICSSPATEQDWYQVTLTQNVSIALEFTGASNDLDLYLLNAQGQIVERAESNAGINESILTTDIMASGMYYVVVTQYAPMNTAAAVGYTLRLDIPECDPSAWPLPACNTSQEPVCTANGTCGLGSAMCTGDTDGEPADDGPGGGRALSTTNLNGQICTQDDTEQDFYTFTINVAGSGQTVNLAWADTTVDLDLDVFDSTGRTYGQSYYGTGTETITLTNLAAGTYYARVVAFLPQGGTPSLAAIPYTINSTTTGVTLCTGVRSCGTEHATQVYRGTCTVNVCSFIEGAGAVAQNAACDSNDDCMAGRCSYVRYESDAQKSVCGPMSCTADAMCTAVNADLRCTTGFQTNFCQPSCTADLQCGVNIQSPTLDVGQPWNYFTCNTTTNACTAQ